MPDEMQQLFSRGIGKLAGKKFFPARRNAAAPHVKQNAVCFIFGAALTLAIEQSYNTIEYAAGDYTVFIYFLENFFPSDYSSAPADYAFHSVLPAGVFCLTGFSIHFGDKVGVIQD